MTDGRRSGDAAGGQARRSFLSTAAFVAWLVLLTAVVVVLDIATGTRVRLAPLLVFLPAFFAGVGTLRQTVVASLWATAIVGCSAVYLGGNLFGNMLSVLFTAAFGALSIVTCRYRTHRDEMLVRLRSTTAALQRQLLRPLPLVTEQVTVEGVYQPVEEDNMVGGDVYEVAASPYGTRVLIADVQGKGLPAIGAAFAVLGAFRDVAHREPALSVIVDALEQAVVRHNRFATETGEPERFVTALLLDIDGGLHVRAVNCGHIPPYLLRSGQAAAVALPGTGVPLGLARLTRDPHVVERFAFPQDATLVLCTDGVTDARNAHGDFYPLRARLRRWGELPPERLTATLRADLAHFTGGNPRDDIAVLALRRRSRRRLTVDRSVTRHAEQS
ncbi:PP2C family protein-serine/threonine phosphatase [Microtetraspora fusca]|uniref:PP2C family protein-serine/threonine phosphatase n=1 Tax=Microtetraspora fusca TaxID=1997 RepID=UPI00082C0C71|nr:PP2C family protein-serine/threonine phosphatase [Microtetraspora fusca]